MTRSAVTTTFVARESQVAELADAVARAAAGRPGVVLVGADAGVGKTRLLHHVGGLAAEAGAMVITVHCVDLGEIGLPYLPFADLLAQLDARGTGIVARAVEARPALGRLLADAGAGQPGTSEDRAERLRLFDGIAAVVAAAGRPGAPLVLVIEDLHWADSSSRDVLRFLVARLRDEHVLLVASYRADDLHRRHPLRPMLAEMGRHPNVERIDLPPFTRPELRAFTTALRGAPLPEDALERIAERSEGNAYFAEELVEAGPGTSALPWTLVDVLRARLEPLDPDVQALARIAAVAGRRVSEPLLRAVVAGVAGDPDPRATGGLVAAALDVTLREAVAHHVLVGEDGLIAFRHALLAEAVYEDLLPGERVDLHRRYAAALMADPALGPPSALALHALRANDLTTALSASRTAADDAARMLAPAEELRHLETVLQVWDAVADAPAVLAQDRIEVLSAAAGAASRSGHRARAVLLAREAVELADGSTRQAALRTTLARYLLGEERIEEALDETARALSALRVDDPPHDVAWAHATHARAALNLGLDDAAHASATAAVEVARAGGETSAEADALATLAVLVVDDADHVSALLRRARDRAREAGDVVTELRCTYNLASTRYYAGDVAGAAEVIADGIAGAQGSGLERTEYATELRWLAEVVRYVGGDLTAGAEPAAPGSPLAAVRLYSAVARGDTGAVAQGRAMRQAWESDGLVALVSGGCTVDALTWAGEHEAAVELAVELVDHLGRVWSDYFLGGIWISALALAALADGAASDRLLGDDAAAAAKVARGEGLWDRALATAEKGRPRGGRLGPEARAWLARARAERSRLSGADDPALWRATVDEFAYGYRYEEARTRWRWAGSLLAAGDADAAAEQVSAALATADAIGAGPLASAVRALARRGRLDVPGVRSGPSTILTEREVGVLSLVALGLTNRQIGERLFISGKTVSVHVSNVLAKLGAQSRTEAATKAHHLGLLDPRD